LRAFFASCSLGDRPTCALWGDRDKFTVAERHYETVIVDPTSPKYEYPPGATRRSYGIKLLAPYEFLV